MKRYFSSSDFDKLFEDVKKAVEDGFFKEGDYHKSFKRYSMIIQPATWQEVNMTSFHDQTIRFTYNDLVRAFGNPTSSGDKTNCEWSLKINNVPFTIYDWKEPFNPEDFPDHYSEWHIGSHEPLSLENLIEIRKFVESKF